MRSVRAQTITVLSTVPSVRVDPTRIASAANAASRLAPRLLLSTSNQVVAISVPPGVRLRQTASGLRLTQVLLPPVLTFTFSSPWTMLLPVLPRLSS